MSQEFWSGFREVPASCAQAPFWFLNDRVDGDEYCRQIDEMARQGVRQAMPHPRFGMDRRDYLSEEYFRAFGQLLEHARARGFTIHLYDEFNWSSGNAGGRLTREPDQCALGIAIKCARVSGPGAVEFGDWERGFMGWARMERVLFAGYAPRTGEGEIDIARQTPVAACAQSGETLRIEVERAGDWYAYAIYALRTRHPSPLRQGNGGIVDYLNPEVTRRFIECTHAEYAHRFGQYFGTTIPSIFYDEVGPYAAGNFTWTADFDAAFQRDKGYSIIERLPLLFLEGPEAHNLRCDYWDVLSRRFCESFLLPIRAWCRRHGIALTGHAHEDSELWTINGGLLRALRCQDWVGLDSLGGYKRFSALKPAVSAAHISGGEVVLCEALGLLGGWDCSPRMLRRAYNQLAIAGVNLLVPHAFFQSVDNPKVECPPSFFECNPYWSCYRELTRMTDLQCYVNRFSRHVADAAVFYPVVSWWALSRGGRGRAFPWGIRRGPDAPEGAADWQGECAGFDAAIDALMADHIDLDVLDDVALNEARCEDGRLRLHGEEYCCLVLPPMSTMRVDDLALVCELARQGLRVYCCEGFAPARAMERGRDAELAGLRVELERRARTGLAPAALPAAIRAELDCDVTVLQGDSAALDTAHRRTDDADIYLLSNKSDAPLSVRLRLRSMGAHAALLDEYGRLLDADCGAPEPRCELQPESLCYLVTGARALPELEPAPRRVAAPVLRLDLSRGFEFWPLPAPPEAAPQPAAQSLELPVMRTRMLMYESPDSEALAECWREWMRPGYDDSGWDEVSLKRGPALYDHAGSRLFRIALPAGACAIRMPLPVNCEYALYANGRCLRVETARAAAEPGWLSIQGCEDAPGVLGVELSAMAPGFGFTGPVTCRIEPRRVELDAWASRGLDWYSGWGAYRRKFSARLAPGTAVELELGEVRECAQVYLNGSHVGTRIWPPYAFDLTPSMREGENELCIAVCNLISNEFAWDHCGTRGDGHRLTSGLMGPVELRVGR